MLRVEDLVAGYGNLCVLHGVSLQVPRASIVALLGSNGAGKTTTMNVIAGLARAMSGVIELDGHRIDKMPAHRIFASGVALVPQGRELFPDMTVEQNLELGGRALKSADERGKLQTLVHELFPKLRERAAQLAGTLSGGEQAMLATSRAIMSKPALLLLDEPTAGLAPMVVDELARALLRLNRAGQAILLVEQNIRMALKIADYVYVMRVGRIAAQGPVGDFRNDEAILKDYFG
jgi:branched-chain amino acid transport system ATP-binding protein